jgi:uncharacterized damage-inducible protein DinB
MGALRTDCHLIAMAKTLLERYRRWFDYERDSHAKALASLASVPEAKRSSRGFAKAVTLMGHLAAARQLWLFRFGVTAEAPRDFFPTGLTLSELADRVERVQSAWSAYLERLDDQALARVFEYQSLDGGSYRNTVEDILTQLFGHSWYHRGQIASLVREAGGEPAVTDFVFWTRQPIPPPP